MSWRADVAGSVDLFEVHRRDPRLFPFLLESLAAHPQSGRYDLLFGFPQAHALNFDELARAFSCSERVAPDTDLPFLGGWFLLLGYEAAAQIEARLRLPASNIRLPAFAAVRCPAVIVHDRVRALTTLYCEDDPRQLAHMQRALQAADGGTSSRGRLIDRVDEDDPQRFLDGVARIHDYLRAGDTFQINLSRGWRARLGAGATYTDVYQRLRRSNPAPFAGLALMDGVAVLSSSPERLVQLDGAGGMQTRPIAGTRPRGEPGTADAALRAQLIGSLKERAEHVMLLDLERNDLGRVCVPGSVEVSELMSLESYAHVHHIVSNVRGRLQPGVGPAEVLRAVFPGGTITGCPKPRAMEIIAELEGTGRGPYTGAMGYLSRCGRLDTNILIRSCVVQDGEVSFRAGAGIVADSQAVAELAETRQKARGLLLALGAEAA